MTKIVLCGVVLSLSVSAQDVEKTAAVADKIKAEVQMQAGSFHVTGDQMLPGKTVKGRPYSAQALSESVQTLADGNRIVNSSSSTLYRDSQGRERREQSVGGSVRSIFISDPVENVNYTLEPGSKMAHKNSVRNLFYFPQEDAIKMKTEKMIAEMQTMVITTDGRGPGGNIAFRTEFNSDKLDSKTENLGMQVMEGVSVEGTRTTVTIPAGRIGNDKDIVTVSERWFSPDLQTVVMTTRSDPRMGTTTYKLTNINRSEPAASLFQVPADYKMAEPETRRTTVIREDHQ